MKKLCILLFSSFITTMSFAQSNVDVNSEKQKIQAVLADWKKRGESGNTDSILVYWADDAMIIDHGKTIKGKDEIRKLMQMAFGNPNFKIDWDDIPQTMEVSAGGDMAYMIVGNTVTIKDASGEATSMRNKSLQAWRKSADGGWKCAVVMMNTEEN